MAVTIADFSSFQRMLTRVCCIVTIYAKYEIYEKKCFKYFRNAQEHNNCNCCNNNVLYKMARYNATLEII